MLRLAIALLFALVASTAHATVYDAIKVIDGDTLVLNGERIRLHGIDAPEAKQTCQRDGKAWPCGQEAAR